MVTEGLILTGGGLGMSKQVALTRPSGHDAAVGSTLAGVVESVDTGDLNNLSTGGEIPCVNEVKFGETSALEAVAIPS